MRIVIDKVSCGPNSPYAFFDFMTEDGSDFERNRTMLFRVCIMWDNYREKGNMAWMDIKGGELTHYATIESLFVDIDTLLQHYPKAGIVFTGFNRGVHEYKEDKDS